MKRFILLCGLAMPCVASVVHRVPSNEFSSIDSKLESLDKKIVTPLALALMTKCVNTPPDILNNVPPLSDKEPSTAANGWLPSNIRERVLRDGASRGDQYCLRQLARSGTDSLPLDENEAAKNMADAVILYRSNAEVHPYYALNFAYCLLFGIGVPQDALSAATYFWKAILGGHPIAQYVFYKSIDQHYKYCSSQLPEFDPAINFLLICVEQSAHQGYAPAQSVQGNRLREEGRYTEAAELFKRSAEQGDKKGQSSYGGCLFQGEGVEKDKKLAVHYFKLSADQGDAEAQCNYGICLDAGEQVAKDLVKAASYFRLAADQGHPRAQFFYGHALITGRGVIKDPTLGADFLKRSADQGYAESQFTYGAVLLIGEDVEPDINEALRYYGLAAYQKYPCAMEYVVMLIILMMRARGAA
ncbi:MAG: sel1 repeat family protein [Holosporales bacterium]|jgi:TPR repeat protein|nr:sel1 repeat family protein [Holosporales bacterium]